MKTVQNVKNSLKFKANEKEGVLSVRVGVKKFTLPVTVRMINGENYLFLSFPASSELYRVTENELIPLEREDDATEAHEALSPGKRKGRRKSSNVEVPDTLSEALKSIPAGYRLGYGTDGSLKLVRTRQRRSKA